MNDDCKEDRIRKFIDGELSSEEEAELMHYLVGDDSFRKILHLDSLLRRDLKKTWEVPADFSDTVMQKIEVNCVDEQRKTEVTEKIARWTKKFFQSRSITIRPVYGFAMVILFIIFSFLILRRTQISGERQNNNGKAHPTHLTNTATSRNSVTWVRFVYVDGDAQSMAVAGNFNGWQPVRMHRRLENGQTIWTVTLPLPNREIHYMFLKDGKDWLSDPLAQQQQNDGFGHHNSVLFL